MATSLPADGPGGARPGRTGFHDPEGQALCALPDDPEGQALCALPDDPEGQALCALPDDPEGQALCALPDDPEGQALCALPERSGMARLWIVHRDARWREALRRLATTSDVRLAAPGDAAVLAGAEVPRAVVLGVVGDFEAELEFAHRGAAHFARSAAAGPGTHPVRAPVWVLLAAPRDVPEVRRLFDALDAAVIAVTSDPTELGRRLREALARREIASLAARRQRDGLVERFSRWLGDLDPQLLLPAVDPDCRDLPLVVRGEPGTGRGLLARYAHLHRAGPDGAPGGLACVAGGPGLDARRLLEALVAEASRLGPPAVLTVCVEDADRLAPAVQRDLARWIEHAPPAGALTAARLRWIATAGDPEADEDRLEPDLARALAGVAVRIPPLRERPDAAARSAVELARALEPAPHGKGAAADRLAPEALAVLRAHPWPGNARELEAVVRRTLAAVRGRAVRAEDLRFEPLLAMPDDPEGQALRAMPHDPEGQALRAMPHDPEGQALRAMPTPGGGAPEMAPRAHAAEPEETALRRLAGAVAHEVANPLVGIRTFAQMLPSRFDDPEFRAQIAQRLDADTRRIEAVIETLARLGSLPAPERGPVDVSDLLARLLRLQRGRLQERRIVALEELDREHPLALGDEEQLRFAFGLLLEEALAWIPARGDLYLATRHTSAEGEESRLRILLRARGPGGGMPEAGLRPAEHALAVAAVEAIVRAHGGSLAVQAGEPGETLVLIELPAPTS